MDDQGTEWQRNIAKNFNWLSRVHERWTEFTFAKKTANPLRGVRGEASAEIDFCAFLIQQKASSTAILAITGV